MSAANSIQFKCTKRPYESVLAGFSEGRVYKGRYFNGLYQVSEEWGTSKPTIMIEKKDFEKYFEIIKAKTPVTYVLSA